MELCNHFGFWGWKKFCVLIGNAALTRRRATSHLSLSDATNQKSQMREGLEFEDRSSTYVCGREPGLSTLGGARVRPARGSLPRDAFRPDVEGSPTTYLL
jgi:hypothetical protein